ncbi:MAG: cytochrome C [Alphaproteobacteria bacterium]|nr:cytochrome C [Alphaproteobacteria bacterium]
MRAILVPASAIAAISLMTCLALAEPNGRLLASNCFQCHGTNGKPAIGGFERLAGMPEAELFDELKELQRPPGSGESEEAIMAVHANGYTDAELHLIAKFFAARK